MGGSLSRRGFLAGAVSLLAAGEALPRIGGDLPAGAPDLSKPAENLDAVLRVTGSLAEEDVPWWYDGTIFGIVGEQQPRPLVKFEGMELYWVRHLDDGEYELIGNTVTFFRDVETGKMIDTFENPYTGKNNTVTPAVQGGGPGRGFNYSVRGIRPTPFMEQMPEWPLVLDWSFARDMVWLHNQTQYPPGMPPPRAQRQTMFVPLAQFSDRKIKNLPTVFSSTVFMPWLKWMDMGNLPGHVIWHASGAKLESMDQLPTEYRRRAEMEFPQYMTANPEAREKWMKPTYD
ncbi:MAG: DUF1838 family protein [Chromatiales bacterium]|nr:MAG: DUF1838 family protein [Chromatiales bacterium]